MLVDDLFFNKLARHFETENYGNSVCKILLWDLVLFYIMYSEKTLWLGTRYKGNLVFSILLPYLVFLGERDGCSLLL